MSYPELDKYYKPCGPCMFCGHPDKRHRLWDTFIDMAKGGDDPKFIAACFEEPEEHIEAVLRLKPYQD
jgi:hypothetical protein